MTATPAPPPASGYRIAASALLGGAAAVGLYAALVEPRRLQICRETIHVPTLPADLDGLRIALLTDLHAGRLTPRSVLERAVEVTREERPDLIAITGDFVDRDADDLRTALEIVGRLDAPLGVYAVPGNHDHVHVGVPAWQHALSRYAGVHDVTNTHVLVRAGSASLCIAGVEDLEEGTPRLDLPLPHERDFTLLLAHNPEQAERSRRSGDAIDLILSGHTHGGQVRIPHFGALHRKSDIYDHGLRRRPWTQVYTSRGVGNTFLPFRFLARPELTLLALSKSRRERW